MTKLYKPLDRVAVAYALLYWAYAAGLTDDLSEKYLSLSLVHGTRCDALRRSICSAPEHDPRDLNKEECSVLVRALEHWLDNPPSASTFDAMSTFERALMLDRARLSALRDRLVQDERTRATKGSTTRHALIH